MREQQGLTLTRRHLLKGVVGGAAGLVLGASRRVSAAAAQAVSGTTGVQRLADDLFVLQLPGEANVVAQTSAAGVVLVDGGSAKARSLGILGLFIGIPTALTGMTLYSYGRFSDRDGMQLAGAIVLGTGALTLLASLPLLLVGSTAVRDGRGRVIATHPVSNFGTF